MENHAVTTDESAFALKLLVSNASGAAIIGPGGSAVKRLKLESGVHSIHLSANPQNCGDRSCAIVGPVAAIKRAYELISALMRDVESGPQVSMLGLDAVRLLVPDGASLVGLSALAELQRSSGCSSIEATPPPLLSQRRGVPPPKEKMVTCRGSVEACSLAVFGMLGRIAARHEHRHKEFFSSWSFPTEYSDHFETPPQAYADIAPLLESVAAQRHPESSSSSSTTTSSSSSGGSSGGRSSSAHAAVSQLSVYDPYFCQGKMVRALCDALPALDASRVINANRDFYADVEAHAVPDHDVLVSNPPYSGHHKQRLLSYLSGEWQAGGQRARAAVAGGGSGGSGGGTSRPFLLLLPAWMAGTSYWQEFVQSAAGLCKGCNAGANGKSKGGRSKGGRSKGGRSKGGRTSSSSSSSSSAEARAGIFYVSPAVRYNFSHPQATGHATSPFHAVWFCGGWASDKDRRRAMRSLRPLRRSGQIECFRSAKMLQRRGHFAKGAASAEAGVVGSGREERRGLCPLWPVC
jgi:hypothetical protein